MNATKILLAGLIVGSPALALAQPDPGDGGEVTDGAGEGEATTSPDPQPTPAPTSTAMSASTSAAGVVWGQNIIQRPLTMPKGMIRAEADLSVTKTVTVTVDGTGVPHTSSGTAEGLAIGGGYAVDDKLEVGAAYAFALHPFEAKGLLSVYGLYGIKEEEKLRIAGTASIGVTIEGQHIPVGLGAAVQYHLNDKMMVFTPGNQLSLGFNDATTAYLTLPVGFGFQAADKAFLSATTSLATIGLHPSGSSIIFADYTPLALSGFYSPTPNIDAGVTISSADVPHIDDFFSLIFTVRYYTGGGITGGGAM